MYRPLDTKLHFSTPQDTGEYFGKDCGKRSLPHGQGQNAGTITTSVDVYPCLIPYSERQHVNLNRGYDIPRKGNRPMHATTMSFKPSELSYQSSTHFEYGGRKDLVHSARPHACRSMHTSQIVFGTEQVFKDTTYETHFRSKYEHPHHKVLEPILINKAKSIDSSRMKESMASKPDGTFLSQYGVVHNKLGAMLDMSKPKYEIPQPKPLLKSFNPLTGEGQGDAKQSNYRKISGNRVLYSEFQRSNTYALC